MYFIMLKQKETSVITEPQILIEKQKLLRQNQLNSFSMVRESPTKTQNPRSLPKRYQQHKNKTYYKHLDAIFVVTEST
jgi:hypothetical protein